MNNQIIEIGDFIKLKFSNSVFGIVIDIVADNNNKTIFYYVFTTKNKVQIYAHAFLEIVTKCEINE